MRLQDDLFLGIIPRHPPWNPGAANALEWPYNTLFFLPVHTFLKGDAIEAQLRMRATNQDDMKELFKEDPIATEHASIEGRLVLTGPARELRAFVLKHARDNRLFSQEMTLPRKTR